MSLAFRSRLEFRLVLAVGLGLLAFALVAGLFTYGSAYQHQHEAARTLQQQLVATIQAQAEVAVYAADPLIAGGVVEGLLANTVVAAVRIESARGDFHRAGGKWGGGRTSRYPLYSPIDGKERIGALVILQNDRHVDRMAADAAVRQTLLLLAQMLLAGAIMTAFLRVMMVNPITRLTRDLAAIEPGSGERVTVEAAHAEDQIGQLAQSANSLLDAAGTAMAQVRQTNASLEQALARLTQKDREKTRFFAAASHDLRQPIQAMRLFLDALKQVRDADERARLVEAVEVASRSLNELLDTLLDVSRLDAGAVVPRLERVGLDEIFTWLDGNFSPLALDRQLRFKLWFPERPLALHTDKRLLDSILANLVGNALKYTRRGGVLVSFRRRRDRCLFQVWDSGGGIDAEHLPHIFDEFYQVDNPNRDRAKGLGLGLAIVRRTAQLLGYAVECRSRPGRGSVFTVSLPLAALHMSGDAAAAAPAAAAVDDRQFRGRHVWVLEDDPLVGNALGDWLISLGCVVSIFASAEQALAAADKPDADFFLVDFQLAGAMNGFDFLDAVRRERAGPIHAVVVSGNTSGRFIEAAERSRWPILFKPADPAQILARLAEAR
jgi:signal transduction histidine kinase/CheY-like chemotaxis protein